MWCLVSDNDSRVIYITARNTEVLIGRNADAEKFTFVIPDDPSISRKHALLTSSQNQLFLKDLESRYGTFINNINEKIEPNSMIQVNDQTIIKFGKMTSVWKVNLKALVTCTSTLKGENLQNLRQCLSNLSGILKNEWDDSCLFLTMPAITLTMKVVLALVEGAFIVTVDYWHKCTEAVINQTQLPDPKKFTPQIIESTLNKDSVSFLPNFNRQSLFVGKKLIFFSKRQYEMYKNVLTKASATALLLSECKMTKSALCEENVIVIQYSTTSATQETQNQRNMIQEIVNYLKNKGRRLVTDVEIGLAILYCSTEKYCNPEFNFPSEVIKQSDQNSKPSKVLAPESQDTTKDKVKDNILIDESLSASFNTENCKRKGYDDTSVLNNPNKKIAVNNSATLSSENSLKRKDIEEHDSNESKRIATGVTANDSQTFNFVSKDRNEDNKVDSSSKRLNLIKPQKRRLDTDDDQELFQFVQDKSKMPCNSKTNIFDTSKVTNVKIEADSKKNGCPFDNIDLESMRGVKLEELMKNNEKLLKSENVNLSENTIKKEIDELKELTLGLTIVTIKKELIVKKEPLQITELNSEIKNFKKFKKVWPVKMQITLTPTSFTTINSEMD